MKKIVFLDVDGVLNSADWAHENHIARLKDRDERGAEHEFAPQYCYPMGHLSPKLIDNLNKICEKTGCYIVVSSTWRLHNTIKKLGEYLMLKGFKYSDRIIDRTDNFNISYGRGYEIQHWLNQHADEVSNFVILDDDWDMHHLMPWLVQTDYRDGLTLEHVALAISILNGVTDVVPYHERRSYHAKHMTDEVWGKESRYGISL